MHLFAALLALFSHAPAATDTRIDKAVEQLNDKTWVLEQVCEGDSCKNTGGRQYHYFFTEGNLYDKRYYVRGISQQAFSMELSDDRVERIFSNERKPVLNFLPSPANADTLQVMISGEFYDYPGTLVFLSPQSFMLAYDHTTHKEYYRLTNLPEPFGKFMHTHPCYNR